MVLYAKKGNLNSTAYNDLETKSSSLTLEQLLTKWPDLRVRGLTSASAFVTEWQQMQVTVTRGWKAWREWRETVLSRFFNHDILDLDLWEETFDSPSSFFSMFFRELAGEPALRPDRGARRGHWLQQGCLINGLYTVVPTWWYNDTASEGYSRLCGCLCVRGLVLSVRWPVMQTGECKSSVMMETEQACSAECQNQKRNWFLRRKGLTISCMTCGKCVVV